MLGLFSKKPRSRNRRNYDRVSDDNTMVIVGDISFAVADWSVDGFRALGYRGEPNLDDELRGRLVVVHAGRPMGFNVEIRVVRADQGSREIAGQFIDMSRQTRSKLERVYEDKLARAEQAVRRRAGV
jgi:hypothetical protein